MSFHRTNGIRMHLSEAGRGEPLLLLMGITAPGTVWAAHSAAWSRGFRCLMPDNRGVGRSSAPRGPYTSAQMADDHAGLLDALGIPDVQVVGCSMGSIIAQQLALRHPRRVRSLVLMCPWAHCDPQTAAIFDHLVTCRERLPPAERVRFIQLLIHARETWDDPRWRRRFRAAQSRAAQTRPAQTRIGVRGQAAACQSHDTRRRLADITCPTLVIGGEEDRFTPPWMAHAVAAGIPDSELHLYPGAGHAFHWERIADFNPRIRAWLECHRRPVAAMASS